MTESALSLFGISVCPDVFLYLNPAHSPVIFHFIQVFLPQVKWLLSNTAFRKVTQRGCLCVCVCAGGWRGTKDQKKEREREGNTVGWMDLNIVWSRDLGQVHQSVISLPGFTEMKEIKS